MSTGAPFRIREMVASHAGDVLRINAGARSGVTALWPAELTRLMEIQNRHLVADCPGQGVVGYLLAFPGHSAYSEQVIDAFRRTLAAPLLYIDQVAVAEPARRRGVGRALYAHARGTALDERIRFLCCEVNAIPANPDSEAFHNALGFESRGLLRTPDRRTVTLFVEDLATVPWGPIPDVTRPTP